MSEPQVPEQDLSPPNCPTDCPNRQSKSAEELRAQRLGLEIAAIALTLFIGAWVGRGWLERKTPTVFEIGFAIACVYLARVDPKAAKAVSARAVGRYLAADTTSEQ
ncbi:hypothetical protein H6G00_05030 [Leptolyngbya sp. FACHB-541]|uniref:hypothetical protein n=1 Tax=Leptolyngbya sp. FACHB-541 TaxID=2692810 RepID=UPI00168748A0|nr:hypothetical protein [Leptolyngbya sp. FACHB-541]MBD1995979.1 hypothetical protein [Leptolyngbya sp. FACHB-541]